MSESKSFSGERTAPSPFSKFDQSLLAIFKGYRRDLITILIFFLVGFFLLAVSWLLGMYIDLLLICYGGILLIWNLVRYCTHLWLVHKYLLALEDTATEPTPVYLRAKRARVYATIGVVLVLGSLLWLFSFLGHWY